MSDVIHGRPNLSTDILSRRPRNVGVYIRPMKKLIGRLNDWRHERHISHLSAQCREAYEAGDKAKARHFCDAMRQARGRRSPEQIARMELAAFRRLAPHEQSIFLKHAPHPEAK